MMQKTLMFSVVTTGESLIKLLNRSLNTMEPQKIPIWALHLSDELKPTDKITIRIESAVPHEEKPLK